MTRIRTLDFLPEIFQTPTNSQFLGATLDQLVNPPVTKKIQGYIGSRFGYGINATNYYVTEPTKVRTDYQLDPGVIFTKPNESVAQDLISYPGILDALKIQGGITTNNDRLFNSEFYSWDSFTDLDKIINYNQYYWLPEGPPSVTVSSAVVFASNDFIVTDLPNAYNIRTFGSGAGTLNPTITLLRGGTYNFIVDQNSNFWIQGEPGVSGYSPTQPNLYVRDVFGVTNNGATQGIVSFTVPAKNAQDEYNFPGNNQVDLVTSTPYGSISGLLLSQVIANGGIDGVTSIEGLSVLFYDTGIVNEQADLGAYDLQQFDQNQPGLPLSFDTDDYITQVDQYFYKVTYLANPADPTDPFVVLLPDTLVPVTQKITARYGTANVGLSFYKATTGPIYKIPYITAPLDTLYYQDGTTAGKVGVIKIIESNLTNTLNVETEILGQKNFTSTNGVKFTNGLKVNFDGDVIPRSYLDGNYYVQGVGTSIELIPESSLFCPEAFTSSIYIPYDTLPYDIGNYDNSLFIPTTPDYITIARNSINANPWSRSNRWFHIDVINATATYNNDPAIPSIYATSDNKAKRPIIEFYPNLRLFNSGTVGLPAVDFIDYRATDAFTQVANQEVYYVDTEVYTEYTGTLAGVVSATSTTFTVPTADIKYVKNGLVLPGSFQIGQFVSDTKLSTTSLTFQPELPPDAQITDILTVGSNTVLTISWSDSKTILARTNVSLIGNDINNNNYLLFDGARIIFAADENLDIKSKIYVVNYSTVGVSSRPVITLTEAPNGQCLPDDETVILRGFYYQGASVYYDGLAWIKGQQKTDVNQPPLFDIFDKEGISFGNSEIYVGTSFKGTKLFSYGIGAGIDDPILGFPIRYSSINNVGDISFDVSLNIDEFTYVDSTTPKTQKINTGYVYNYTGRTTKTRELGWQTAVAPSVQYQIFQFKYTKTNPITVLTPGETYPVTYTCDIAVMNTADSVWPVIQVYNNNRLLSSDEYTYTVTPTNTIVTVLNIDPNIDTEIQVLLLSDQVSPTAYYGVPINLQNNPFNTDITTANIGDIRGQYQSIFTNNPDTQGEVFGPNNYRDLGNLVPWGTKIIQNSASLVLPAAFLRKKEHNLFDALLYNSREYIKFKTLLVDTVNNSNYNQRFDPSYLLDDALDQITSTKNQEQSFFWSDMIPSKAPYLTNTYKFANDLDTSIYPLSRVYNYNTANYYGVLVYLNRTIDGVPTVTQLLKEIDYTISSTAPSLTITKDLVAGDQVVIKEYNQTYGSYIPNTPTKLGLYPSFIPEVVLDTSYTNPTYFIRGHDGSYNKLYGEYVPELNALIDFRDQVLLEFEKRVFNNLKLGAEIPITSYEILPGFFRDSDFTYDEWLEIYSTAFLDWIGQNKLQYKTQLFNTGNEFTYNYTNSANKIGGTPIQIGNWRGLYSYYYDTSTPNLTPWEMLGFADQPSWWTDRYGPSPYTSDNLVLWTDLANGINYNNGNPVVIPQAIRPNLLNVLPVDSAGNLLSPLRCLVGNYTSSTFRRDWKVGDDAPVEYSYRRSSTWPFDLMRLIALTKPAEFFNLGVDLDNYRYNQEFGQYLVNDRSHLIPANVEIYGNGTAKTSYINWIVDYEKQLGVAATQNITSLLDNLDVRLVYRLAGYSDKNLLKFYVEKSSPNSRNASLLIPDESYQVLLYDNEPYDRLVYSGIIVQKVDNGWAVFGNSQTNAYFKTLTPKFNGIYENITVEKQSVKIAAEYSLVEQVVPYGTIFYSTTDVAQFVAAYGKWAESKGAIFTEIAFGQELNWNLMIQEFLYWTQMGWELGSVVTLNPAAGLLLIDKESTIVQPLTIQKSNFILNQNLYPIQLIDLNIVRKNTEFAVKPLNVGDTIAYGQFNLSNFEHAIVFDNITLFDDIVYNLVTGLRQNRIRVAGTKSAEWDGTINASGFIYNQDNITEWKKEYKYTKGSIVKYKNKYWTALAIIQPGKIFNEQEWKETDYNEVQKGLLPNSSTRSYESTLYYDVDQANLEQDADLLSFSLIGYRPRDYLAIADLTDITQVNVYKNMIKNKGTENAVKAFKGANLPQGGIDYDVYENWAIKTGEFGGVLNNNFVEFKINENDLTGNPSTFALTDGIYTPGVQQEIPLYSLYNYSKPVTSPDILPTLSEYTPSTLYPDAGYVNFNDVKMLSYFYSQLAAAVDKNGLVVPIQDFYVRDYAWLANYLGKWQVFTPESIGRVLLVRANTNNTCTVSFASEHGLSKYQIFAIVNFDTAVNGYYVVSEVLNPTQVIITLTLNSSVRQITGQGIGFKFNSQRVDNPADIANLPLINNEFTQNTVWVDENDDGGWAVYRKALNYKYEEQITKDASLSFGTAVAYSPAAGYLITDDDAGKLYRYTYSDLAKVWSLNETITNSASFGRSIAHTENLFVVSQPTTSPRVFIYTINDSQISDDFVLYQTITRPVTVTGEWGTKLALSGDSKWLYISAYDDNKVHVYRKQNIDLSAGYFNSGSTYIIKELGNTDFTALGAVQNKVGIIFQATGAGTIGQTGIATQINYEASAIIDGTAIPLVSGDNFGEAIATDYYGDTVAIGAPNVDYSATIDKWGKSYIYNRVVQNFEVQYNIPTNTAGAFNLAWTHPTLTKTATATNSVGNTITLNNVTSLSVNQPIVFSGSSLTGTGITSNIVYYINSIVGSTITIKTSRSSTTAVTVNTVSSITVTATVQSDPLYVSVNGTVVQDNNYSVIGTTFYYTGGLNAGDIVNVSGQNFILVQTLTSQTTPRIGVQFGTSIDTTRYASEILVGAPFELSNTNQEGAVYRYTNGGGKYGSITGTAATNVTTNRTLLINGYSVIIPPGNATVAANAINSSTITNIQATAQNGYLTISVINNSLTQVNEKLLITVVDTSTLSELGLNVYTQTQTILCPHKVGPTQFGTVVKFNEHDSFVVSAPTGTRFAATTFDFVDDSIDNDTVFDNNATQWIDQWYNAGAVYMFDYLGVYNESLSNIGSFVYAQSTNAQNEFFGSSPMYGEALEFIDNRVMIGTPNFRVDYVTQCTTELGNPGQVITYVNDVGLKDWSVYRTSSAIVDVSRIQNSQLFSAQTNNTLINLDYFDPLQGKLLGAVRENIDVVSNTDPASYNNGSTAQRALVWGADKVGSIWFDTSNVRFVNYHQNDPIYNAKYWGTLFPGSDVAVYSWVSSNVPPSQYQGPGTVKDAALYTVQAAINSSNTISPIYFFWVRNTGIIFNQTGKTLADTIIASYISNPQNSGISYFSPLLPNAFALYNSQNYINANDTVFHIGYGTGETDDELHNEYNLIRANNPEDFLPGVPGRNIKYPESLYDRMLDSLCGVDESGEIVPNPWLPKTVQSGVLARPRQSFFYNRFLALKNYLTYANAIMSLYPITEIRRAAFLFEDGVFFDTQDYWQFVNWWAVGYDNNTKAAQQVPIYADLSTLDVAVGTIISVAANGDGKQETYRYDGEGVWTRIGLQQGTIEFKSSLWDYASAKFGFGDNFFDTQVYDLYPSEETRYIIRALNEQIYTNELLIYRNKSLILLFEYIESETIESQNYLPWLNKTSLVDVTHKIRELLPIENFKTDNQDFLAGYLNEVKPYHVVIKEFLFSYTGQDIYRGDITDFDLPAQYNSSVETFVSPQLVYEKASGPYEYLPDDPIWQTQPYKQWFDNHGVSLTGQPNYYMTNLASWVTLGTQEMVVDNAQGFPINGVILLGQELIGYSTVDRSTNTLSGLIRGLESTPVSDHIPGQKIYMNLPPVIVLNGGRGYIEPPKVTAIIDTTIYPEPKVPAELEAVMSLDSVLSINVINPGQGYAVLPEIVIAPAQKIIFSSADVSPGFNTIKIYAPALATGDLVRYIKGTGNNIGGLKDGQWYYVNLIQSTPSSIIALYTTYSDAINDHNRVNILSTGSGVDHTFNVGAKASAISTSIPVRENNITLKFDRTTYTSQVIDWEAGRFYGSFFAGNYNNSETVSSSSIQLESTQPPIESILASNQGVVFEIEDVNNDRVVEWSSFIRRVSQTIAANDAIRLVPYDNGSGEMNASGSTIGFYVGMPVKFDGGVGASGIIVGQVYYVAEVINDTDFSIALTEGGPAISLANYTVGSLELQCFVAKVTDTAILTVNYPGIRTATATTSTINTVTVPVSAIGTGGTQGFYTNLPLFFTGNVFGQIVQNQTYYVTTVIDSQTFTMSDQLNPLMLEATATTTGTNRITVSSTDDLSVNEPIIFTGTTFGLITAGTIYYVREIVSTTQITISTSINGTEFALNTASGTMTLTSQNNVLQLTTAAGSMTLNVSLPVSPGQVDGQLFTLYQTSQEYASINNGSVNNLISADVVASMTTANRLAISTESGGTNNMYVNMPFQLNGAIGGLSAATTYYVKSIGVTTIEATTSLSGTNVLTIDDSDVLYVGMPITFAGVGFGSVIIGDVYYVRSIISSTQITLSTSLGGAVYALTTDAGSMTGTGEPYIQASLTAGGAVIALSDQIATVLIEQYPLTTPVFSVSYALGGYSVIINSAGTGFAVNNTITILGTQIGGSSPANDLVLTVNSVDSNGGVTSVIRSGTPAGITSQYYLRVINQDQFAVYSDPLMTVPVSGIDFNYVGFTTTTATAINPSNDRITVTSSDSFDINDPVEFTGTIFSSEITLGQTYYIASKPTSTTVTISLTPDGSTINFTGSATGSMTMAKAGSFALLPEPFYFNQSIVKYNNKVYQCIISNNDDEFILGKWELLRSDDNQLNALDRIIGYYQPTVNMPGVDLPQLVSGITYPNSTYLGNAFEPDQQFPIDTILQDQPFYPTEIDITSVLYDGNQYLGAANLPEYSALITDTNSTEWDIAKLTGSPVSLTDIIYAGGLYVLTSNNSATPIFRSNNGINWTTNGYFTPYGATPYDDMPYDSTSLSVASLSLNSVAYQNGVWVAVGNNIVSSTDTYVWTERYAFPANSLQNYLYGVAAVNLPLFQGFVAVGKGQRYDYSTGVTQIVSTNIILTSTNGISWNILPSASLKGFYAIGASSNLLVTAGEDGVIYTSLNGTSWLGINESQVIGTNAINNTISMGNTSGLSVNSQIKFTNSFDAIVAGTLYYVKTIVSVNQITVSLTLGGPTVTLSGSGSVPGNTYMYKYPLTKDINDILYANSTWMAVGDGDLGTATQSLVLTSTDATSWTTRSPGTYDNLNGLTYLAGTPSNVWTVVGDNNTILQSSDNGVTWTETNVFTVQPTVYDVQGDPFLSGYGPEELVPGLINDSLMMTVSTRPGTNWPATEYAHVGYGVQSIELEPTSALQTEYSFNFVSQNPAQIAVFVIDGTTGLSTSIYDTNDYTVDWVNKIVTLNNPLTFIPVADKLRIDVYQVGNGNQLVKASTETDPIRTNLTTGFNEIYVNCNYTGSIFSGGGVIRPTTVPIEVAATATDAASNSIFVDSVDDFVQNDVITFSGAVFGGIVEDAFYYVKTISVATSSITVSNTLISGVAGATFPVTTASGSMSCIIQNGSGTPWTDPIIYHNGSKLILGHIVNVTRTKSSNNGVTCISTAGVVPGAQVVFSESMFGTVIQPMTIYYVDTVIDSNEFTISTTQGGPTLTLTDATGGATAITGDYSFAPTDNGITAKIVLPGKQDPLNPTQIISYDVAEDYIVYSLFGETSPIQYGYTVPETSLYTGDGSSSQFTLTNFVGDDNAGNAVVEINGIRQTGSLYTISEIYNTITFTSPPAANSTIAVTTFNNTERQYLNTEFGITGTSGSAQRTYVVKATNHSEFPFDAVVTAGSFEIGYDYVIDTIGTTDFTLIGAASNTPGLLFTATGPGTGTGTALVGYDSSAYDEELNWMTLDTGYTTTTMNVNDTIVFDSPTLDGVVAGQNYYIREIWDTTNFVVSNTVGGDATTLTDDTGTMSTFVQGLTVAPIIAINNTIAPPLATTQCTSASAATNRITCDSTTGFALNQPVLFKSPTIDAGSLIVGRTFQITNLGNTNWNTVAGTVGLPYAVGDVILVAATDPGTTGTAILATYAGLSTLGVAYFIHAVPSATTFQVEDENGTLIALQNDSASVVAVVGGNEAVTITTSIDHNFDTNTLIQIDGVLGSTQLNNNTYYARVITSKVFSIYQQPYNPSYTAVNDPVTTVSSYIGGGYTWRQGLFIMKMTTASSTSSIDNRITVSSVEGLVYDTPVYFTKVGANVGDTIMGGLVDGTKYYVRDIIPALNKFTVSATRGGSTLTLTTDTGTMAVTQWEQDDVDRLWVTVNGLRVPSSKLRLNPANNLSILTEIVPGDEVIITSMMPSETPNEEIYLLYVNQSNEPSVYRAGTQTRTWLTDTLYELDDTIYVEDVTRITDTSTQLAITPAAVNATYSIGLVFDKNQISNLTVFNQTTGSYISSSNFTFVVEALAPKIVITAGAYITAGDQLLITALLGNLIYVNGEQIKFGSVDPTNNSISELQRGANGTSIQTVIPKYTEVFGILGNNRMTDVQYGETWNSYNYNTVLGDPLQISDTKPAQFLKVDVT